MKKCRQLLVGGVLAASLQASAVCAADVGAKLQICGSCHGENGVPDDPTVPILWGQQKAYLEKQLRDYRGGARDSQIMSSMAESLTTADVPDVATFLANRKWPDARRGVPQPPPDAVAACQSCHHPNFLGGAAGDETAPRLAGQNREYLAAEMRSFATGGRANHAAMAALMKGLSDGERDAMARYLSGL